MASKISYLILIGIISFTTGKPGYRQDYNLDKNQDGLKKLLEELYTQGNYDISISHHEDGPSSHHEDTAQIIYHGGKQNTLNYDDKYYNQESYQRPREERVDYNNHPRLKNVERLNLFNKKKPRNIARNGTVENNNTSDCMKKLGLCTEVTWDNNGDATNKNEDEDVNEVLEFLNELEKNLELIGNNNFELRCYGNSCGENRNNNYNRNRDDDDNGNDDRNDESYDRHNLRCLGNGCSRDIDRNYEYRSFRDTLRCRGGRCGRNRDDRDDVRQERDNLRCVGDRCGRNRNDDDNRYDREDGNNRDGIDIGRCNGNRCGRNRNYDDIRNDDDGNRYDRDNGDNRDGIDRLRCNGDRCGRNRNDDNNRYDRDDSDNRDNVDSYRCEGDRCSRNIDNNHRNNRNNLACNGDRCGRNRNDRDDDDDYRGSTNSLRCVGGNCARSRDNDNAEDSQNSDRLDIKEVLSSFDKKTKEMGQEIKKLWYRLKN